MSVALIVNNVSKSYIEYKSEFHRLINWFFGKGGAFKQHNVIEGVSFTVSKAEAVGVIGRNGAGKSTLLKIIAGVLNPTSGNVVCEGKITAILELGMGFHPEMTGRENVKHTAMMMGMSNVEVDLYMDEIESFADIGEYFDQPVRVYSSGMYVRVAFAVATALRPDILIVDEALSVGDIAFQRKSYRRIEELVSDGTALLFVSHDIETIKKICDRVLFIEENDVIKYGAAKEVCDYYEKIMCSENVIKEFPNDLIKKSELRYGDGRADVRGIWLEDHNGQKITMIKSGDEVILNYRVLFNEDVSNPVFNMQIKTKEGVVINGVNSEFANSLIDFVQKGEEVRVRFSFIGRLYPGAYYFNCGVKEKTADGEVFISRIVDGCGMDVVSSERMSVAIGLVDLDTKLNIEIQNGAPS